MYMPGCGWVTFGADETAGISIVFWGTAGGVFFSTVRVFSGAGAAAAGVDTCLAGETSRGLLALGLSTTTRACVCPPVLGMGVTDSRVTGASVCFLEAISVGPELRPSR